MHGLRILTAVCLALGAGLVRAEDKPEMDVGFVRLKGTPFAEIKTVAEPLLSAEGKLSYVESKDLLMIRDYPDKIELVKKVIKEIDTVPANIRVEVIFDEQKESRRSALGFGPGGFRIGANSTNSSDFTNQYVVAGDRRPAQIWVGKTVPDVAWVYEYGARRGWWRQELVWQDVGASLWALPRQLPDGLIEVEVYPRLTAKGKEPLSLDVKQLSTKIVVADGQVMPLGGLDQEKCQVYSRLFGRSTVFNGSRLAISLRATVMPVPKRVVEELKRNQGNPPPPIRAPATRPPLRTE